MSEFLWDQHQQRERKGRKKQEEQQGDMFDWAGGMLWSQSDFSLGPNGQATLNVLLFRSAAECGHLGRRHDGACSLSVRLLLVGWKLKILSVRILIHLGNTSLTKGKGGHDIRLSAHSLHSLPGSTWLSNHKHPSHIGGTLKARFPSLRWSPRAGQLCSLSWSQLNWLKL